MLWDPAGQERFETLTKNYVHQLDGIVLAFDVTNSITFENTLKWFKQIKEITERPLIIVGNKADKEDIVVAVEDMNLLQDRC